MNDIRIGKDIVVPFTSGVAAGLAGGTIYSNTIKPTVDPIIDQALDTASSWISNLNNQTLIGAATSTAAVTTIGLVSNFAHKKHIASKARLIIDHAIKEFKIEAESLLANKLNALAEEKSKALVQAMKASEIEHKKGLSEKPTIITALQKMGQHSLIEELKKHKMINSTTTVAKEASPATQHCIIATCSI